MRRHIQHLMSNSVQPPMKSNVPPQSKQATERNVPPAMNRNVPPLMKRSAVGVVEDMEDMANPSAPVYLSRAASRSLNRTVSRCQYRPLRRAVQVYPGRVVPLFLYRHQHRWPRRFVVE